jgi:hypothetical protein
MIMEVTLRDGKFDGEGERPRKDWKMFRGGEEGAMRPADPDGNTSESLGKVSMSTSIFFLFGVE